MDTNNNPSTTGNATRPGMLTVLCILSFIANGLGLLILFLLLVAAGTISSLLPDSLSSMFAGGTTQTIVSLIGCAAAFYGVLQMWSLKKMGFYIYTGAQLLGLIAPLMFGGEFSVMGAIFAALFIVLYYLNLKHMN